MNVDAKLRYLPALKILRDKGSEETVLEVGGGVEGISKFFKEKLTICDVCLDGVEDTDKIKYVQGDARSLPFDDNSFDYIISSDMVEHIKSEDREKVMKELVRVSRKKVIVGFPCGDKAHKWETKLFNLGKKITGKEHKWLKEHVENGLPSEEEIKSYLGEDVQVISNANLKIWFTNELFNPYLWFVPWIFYPVFTHFNGKGSSYRKIFIVSKEEAKE